MKNLIFLFSLLFIANANAQPITYIDKNVDRFECVDIYDATTAKRLTAAVTGADCEYAQTLNGSANESAYADLTTAESVVGSVGQLCFKILAAEDNIDGTIKVSCKVSNTNGADYVGRFSTLKPKIRLASGDGAYDAIAARGTMQSGSTSTTAVLAAAESSADDRYNDTHKLVIVGGTGAGQARCITDYVNSTDTATVYPAWGTTPDNTSTYDIVADAACSSNIVTIATAAAQKIADIVLRRTTANVEASSDGDTLSRKSLYGAAARLTHRLKNESGTLKTYKADGTTVLDTQTITTDSAAQPIIELQ